MQQASQRSQEKQEGCGNETQSQQQQQQLCNIITDETDE
jgi:hypothetical protein